MELAACGRRGGGQEGSTPGESEVEAWARVQRRSGGGAPSLEQGGCWRGRDGAVVMWGGVTQGGVALAARDERPH